MRQTRVRILEGTYSEKSINEEISNLYETYRGRSLIIKEIKRQNYAYGDSTASHPHWRQEVWIIFSFEAWDELEDEES